MLGVLARIVLNLSKATKGSFIGLEEFLPKAEEVRKRILAAGVEAMNARGSVGARAIEVVWASIVDWDEDAIRVEGVELQRDSDTAISSLQPDFFLPQITTAFSRGDTLPESLTQLLAILHRLAQQSKKFAETIVQTPNLISSVFHAFLLVPLPTKEMGRLPVPAALQLLITLASASRANADALSELKEFKGSAQPKEFGELKKPADALLRFIAMLPPSSPFPFTLATSLLILTLRFYRVLASYGLCSSIAKMDVEGFSRLSQYIFSSACESQTLKIAWMDLQSAWTVCAIDPHKTTPVHDILWSQVAGWVWKDEIAQFAQGLGDQQENWRVWEAVWEQEAQWLEGCKLNGVRGGETERLEFLQNFQSGFRNGTRGRVVHSVVETLHRDLDAETVTTNLEHASFHAGLLDNAIRLWLACLPPHLEGPLASPPFELPFSAISTVCAKLVTHSLWDVLESNEVKPQYYTDARKLSGLLASYSALSKKLPGITEELWLAQALSILLRLMPGDEEFATNVVEQVLDLINLNWVNQQNIVSPIVIWAKGGLGILRPFLSHTIQPCKSSRIAPLHTTPESIATSSTLRLPLLSHRKKIGLPLNQDWMFTPLNHLLRSADSEVFKNLPTGWDSSEVEITRATLFFSNLTRDTLTRFSLNQLSLSREEAIFGCMRVFMLEHGQPNNASSCEVFRDPVVERLMVQTLEPYSYGIAVAQTCRATSNLEQVAARYLEGSTPFFQFYTDFVGLYDAISFSEPTFAKLLLPPISMQHARDYRRHLWDDFNHIVKTIRTPCEQVLSSNPLEYLYPIENDSQLVGAYLRALLKEPLQGFVRLIAVHHIASNMWPDLRDQESSNEARAEKLIKAIVAQGNNAVIREVVTYRQNSSGSIRVSPACFEFVGEVAGARLAWIRSLGDSVVISRVEGLLV
jgi:hypothetical protein